MDTVNASSSMGPQLYAMKKATEVQAQSVLKLLESAQVQTTQLQSSKTSGVGQKIDIKA